MDIVVKNGCIYKYTSPSGKCYIGKTNNIERRVKDHYKRSQNLKYKTKFYDAIRKHGYENFQLEILTNNISSNEELNNLEIYFIKLFNSKINGYNLTDGGDGLSKNQILLFNKIEEKYFIGTKDMINENITHSTKLKVTAIDNRTGEIIHVTKKEFDNNINYVGVCKNTITVKNKHTNKMERIHKSEFNENYVGCTNGLTTAWDLRTNTKVHITSDEYKNNDFYVRHLRLWHAPKSKSNINSQKAWSNAKHIKILLNNKTPYNKINMIYKTKVCNIIKLLLSGWNPDNDEIWVRDFDGYKG